MLPLEINYRQIQGAFLKYLNCYSINNSEQQHIRHESVNRSRMFFSTNSEEVIFDGKECFRSKKFIYLFI